jgi:hypothetical protein
MTNNAKLSESDLNQFTGSENWYRHGINRKVLFTDGAKYVADEAGAYWLLDEIALIQHYSKAVAAEEFQVWKLTVRQDHSATLTCDDGNGNIICQRLVENGLMHLGLSHQDRQSLRRALLVQSGTSYKASAFFLLRRGGLRDRCHRSPVRMRTDPSGSVRPARYLRRASCSMVRRFARKTSSLSLLSPWK